MFRIDEVGTKDRIASLRAGRDGLLPIGDIRCDAPPNPPRVVSHATRPHTVEVAAHEHHVLADLGIPLSRGLGVVLIQVLVERELEGGGGENEGEGEYDIGRV